MSNTPSFDVSQFGEVKRVLVVTAHPDDLETACGGTMALLIERGAEVALLLCTDGDIGTHDPSFTRATLAATRREEALAGARVLGLREVFFLGHPDGELVADLTLRAEVAGVYRRWQPDTVFTFDPFWAGQVHPDHTAAGRAAVDAYMPSKMELYHPEQLVDGVKVADVKRFFFFGGSNREGEITINISPVWEKKLAATRCHVSQFGQKEEALQWLAEWNRETGKCCGLEYAEAFHSMRVW
ncbi:MAG: PIG-L deacetylase family protein [Anaerolineae bacterium]